MAKTFKEKVKDNKDTGIKTRKDKMKNQFNKNLWSKNMLRVAVKKGELSAVDFKEITNITY